MSGRLRTFALGWGMMALCMPHGLAQGDAARPAVPAGREISGVVVSAKTGAPLAEAQVMLTRSRDRKEAAATTTDAEGRFAFENLTNGKFDLAATHAGYVSAAYQQHEGGISTSIVTGDGLVSTGLRLELAPQAVIYGVVAEDSGDPVPMARLSLYRRDVYRGTGKMMRVAVTGADAMGNFEFSHVAPGTYYACAFGSPWYALRGRGARGMALDAGSERRLAMLDVAYAATCYPDVTDAGAAEAIQAAAGERVAVNVTMHPAPAVHLKVQLPGWDSKHGPQIPQVSTELFGIREPANAPIQFSPRNGDDEAGSPAPAEIEGITAGQYELELNGRDGESGRRVSVDAAAGASIDLTAATPMAGVSGKIVFAGGLPEGSSVSLIPREGGDQNATQLNADGSFAMQTVRPGEYDVAVYAPGHSLAVERLSAKGAAVRGHTFRVGSEPIELSVTVGESTATVNGVVKRAGSPAAGVFVVLTPDDANAERARWMPNQSDSDGSFNFYHVAPGDYTVVAIEEGWTLEWSRPEVMARYLAGGVKVSVAARAGEVNLKEAVEAQPKAGLGGAAANAATAGAR